ncbi:MAG: neutral/alkaline non-lysosomal ceramidase N-terminal domain-containing protein [Tannerella sp.]|nr:neutral/alkaline non-lysosomal ceramidase N-terminal domain-containing protein [Tannerella sp.]
MKHLHTILFYLLVALGLSACSDASLPTTGWKAGVAQMKITPTEHMWLAGYASRTHASEGTLQDLWAKALVLEDSTGYRSVLVTLDVSSITKGLADRIREELKTRLGLTPSQIILNCSHTHSGPVLPGSLEDIYPLDKAEEEKIDRYGVFFEKQIIDAVLKASRLLEPVSLHAANGVARMQVNRRNNSERDLSRQTELKGPNDFAVPVLKVTSPSGQLKAVVFGYACHPTVLDGYLWSGDWPGYARETLKKWYPGVATLFFQGAGGDQNPLPRRTIPLAKQHGVTIAAAVSRVLQEDMTALPPVLKTAYREISLPLDAPPSEDALNEIIRTNGDNDYRTRWAKRILGQMRGGEPLPEACPYGLQAWNLGGWPLFALGGEVTVGYAIRLKRTYGEHAFVMGYANDVMAYIPTAVILEEGGYEGRTSMMAFGLPAPWLPGIEERICKGMEEVAEQAGIPCIHSSAAEN